MKKTKMIWWILGILAIVMFVPPVKKWAWNNIWCKLNKTAVPIV